MEILIKTLVKFINIKLIKFTPCSLGPKGKESCRNLC